jgi:DHA1 family tetracycline resistance protein-like MFS transporter
MQKGLIFILVIALLDMIGIGLVLPVMPLLIARLTGGDPSSASLSYGAVIASYSLMQFLFSPMWGILSDRFGRRPIILCTVGVAALDYIVAAVSNTVILFLIARAIAGACGANIATIAAYTVDVTPPARRAQAFGLLMAVSVLGYVIGPAIGGLLAALGPRTPFWTASLLMGLSFAFGLFILPESLKEKNKRQLSIRELNPLKNIADLKQSRVLFGLTAALFLYRVACAMLLTVGTLFISLTLGWKAADIGISLAVTGLLMALNQSFVAKFAINKLGERTTVELGLIINALAFFLYGFIASGWQLYLANAVVALGCIAIPPMQAILSRQVEPAVQGQLQGTLASLTSLAQSLGPLIAAPVFSICSSPTGIIYFPSAPFFLGALILLGSFLFSRNTLNERKLMLRVGAEG